jgi:hypothetical protein
LARRTFREEQIELRMQLGGSSRDSAAIDVVLRVRAALEIFEANAF